MGSVPTIALPRHDGCSLVARGVRSSRKREEKKMMSGLICQCLLNGFESTDLKDMLKYIEKKTFKIRETLKPKVQTRFKSSS